MKTTEVLLNEIFERSVITEKEINLIKTRSNREQKDLWNYDFENIELTTEQNNKGLAYLRDLYITPNGKERKNSPFGYREIDVLNDNKAHFYFKGFYNGGTRYSPKFYIPIYVCCGAGTSFEYYVNGGIQIIG